MYPSEMSFTAPMEARATLAPMRRWRFFAASLFLFSMLTTALALAVPITGTVTDRTTNRPSAGDTVVLVRPQQNMQESGRTTTDANGHYTLDISDSDSMHLVRVTHQKANYFQAVAPGTSTVNVDVYDAAPKVEGISMEADVLRIDTDSNGLRVIESFFVKNASAPPRTQVGDHPFDFYLPAGAQIIGSIALGPGPGALPVQADPVPLHDANHYTFQFPLRPGDSRFQISYHLPYSGALTFSQKTTMKTDNLAIMLPKSMQFAPTQAAAFQSVDEDPHAQTFLARNLAPGAKLEFKVTGSGQIPEEADTGQGGQQSAAGADQGGASAAGANAAPGGGLGAPIDTPTPLDKYKWWILGALGALLAAGAGVLLRQPAPQPAGGAARQATGTSTPSALLPTVTTGRSGGTSSPVGAATGAAKGPALLAVLKEELFALETERLEGRLPQEEYDQQKAALEVVLKRALDRNQSGPPSNPA